MENTTTFSIFCKNPKCIGGRIEVSIFADAGYSNWTVMDDGGVEFKCHGCGKFASTISYKQPNEPKNFEVTCDGCGHSEWSPNIQDVDHDEEESNIECETCHNKQYTYED